MRVCLIISLKIKTGDKLMSAAVVFIIGLILMMAAYLFWYFMQPFRQYQVEISHKEIPGRRVLYKEYKGSYSQIKDMYDALLDLLERLKTLKGFKLPLK